MSSPHHTVWRVLKKIPHDIYCYYSVMAETLVPRRKHEHGQLIYMEGGKVYVDVNNTLWYLPARHCMWVPPDVYHTIHVSLPSVLVWTIYFPRSRDDSTFYKKPGIYAVNDLLLEMLYFTQKWHGTIKRKDKNRFLIVSAIKLLLSEIGSKALPFGLPMAKDDRLIRITQYLQDHFSQNIPVRDVAERFQISERTMARLFKQDLHMSFIAYLETLRIIRALELIATNKHTIKEVCYLVGYESVPTFSNRFKKMVGVSPTAYKAE